MAAGGFDPVGTPERPPRRLPTRSRRTRPRATTISIKRLPQTELKRGRRAHPDAGERRLPLVRGECAGGERPCPFVSCKYHLYLDVSPRTGSIKLNFPELEPWELAESCALDVAERGGVTLEEVGSLVNLTRERVRQVEEQVADSIAAELAGWDPTEDAEAVAGGGEPDWQRAVRLFLEPQEGP